MTKILNLALKKDVFEGLQNKTTNEIPIENSKWWKKRLMDLDTGRFKDFTTVSASCGSPEKFLYKIEKIELRENNFVITVKLDKGEQPCEDNGDSDVDDEPIQYSDAAVPPIHTVTVGNDEDIEITGIKGTQEDLLKPEVVNTVTVETDENDEVIVKQTVTKKDLNTKEVVMNLFNKFCELKDVYVVNMPSITIRNNGQIFGCKKRLIADRDSDVKFNFVKKEFVKCPNTPDGIFCVQILSYLNTLLKNNYVFVNKSACGFRNGDGENIVFTIMAVGKRKYFFAK